MLWWHRRTTMPVVCPQLSCVWKIGKPRGKTHWELKRKKTLGTQEENALGNLDEKIIGKPFKVFEILKPQSIP